MNSFVPNTAVIAPTNELIMMCFRCFPACALNSLFAGIVIASISNRSYLDPVHCTRPEKNEHNVRRASQNADAHDRRLSGSFRESRQSVNQVKWA